MDEWMDRRMGGCMNEWGMNGSMYGEKNGWVYECMDEWMDACMDWRMGRCMNV